MLVCQGKSRLCPDRKRRNIELFQQWTYFWSPDIATFLKFFKLHNIGTKLNSIHHAGKINGVDLYLGWVKGDLNFQ